MNSANDCRPRRRAASTCCSDDPLRYRIPILVVKQYAHRGSRHRGQIGVAMFIRAQPHLHYEGKFRRC
jgi:hypothetical protein